MSLLLFLLFGFVVGLLARAIMPGRQGMGIIATTVLGVVGSFLGGAIGSLLAGRSILSFQSGGLIGSIVGALLVLLFLRVTAQRSATA